MVVVKMNSMEKGKKKSKRPQSISYAKKYSVLIVCWVSFSAKLEHIKPLAKDFTAIIFNKLDMDTSSRLRTFFMCM